MNSLHGVFHCKKKKKKKKKKRKLTNFTFENIPSVEGPTIVSVQFMLKQI